jgi:hypothetical protein
MRIIVVCDLTCKLYTHIVVRNPRPQSDSNWDNQRVWLWCEDHVCSWSVNALLWYSIKRSTLITSSLPWGPAANGLVGQKMLCKFFIASTYNYIRNTCLWLLSTRMLYHYLFAIAHVLIIIWIILSMQCLFIHLYAYITIILLFTIVTATVFISLPLLSFCYCYYYKTVATDKLLRASLFPNAAELTTHLLRLINILWLPLCRINKFGFYFPRRLLQSPILVGHQGPTMRPSCGPAWRPIFYSSLLSLLTSFAHSLLTWQKDWVHLMFRRSLKVKNMQKRISTLQC